MERILSHTVIQGLVEESGEVQKILLYAYDRILRISTLNAIISAFFVAQVTIGIMYFYYNITKPPRRYAATASCLIMLV